MILAYLIKALLVFFPALLLVYFVRKVLMDKEFEQKISQTIESGKNPVNMLIGVLFGISGLFFVFSLALLLGDYSDSLIEEAKNGTSEGIDESEPKRRSFSESTEELGKVLGF